MKKYLVITIIFLSSFNQLTYSQYSSKALNIAEFEQYNHYWGFIIAFTQSSLFIEKKPDYNKYSNILSINSRPGPSFAVGPLYSKKIVKNIHFRTGLFLSFQDRYLDYNIYVNDTTILQFDKKIRSVYSEVPGQFKFVTNRINNKTYYLKTGLKLGYDWATKKHVKQLGKYDDIVKIKRFNISGQFGGGIDFFLRYFKFGIDLSLDYGLNNILYQDNTTFSSPISKLRNRVFQISFTFEG